MLEYNMKKDINKNIKSILIRYEYKDKINYII